jgi:hypothetical protein
MTGHSLFTGDKNQAIRFARRQRLPAAEPVLGRGHPPEVGAPALAWSQPR